MKRTRKGFTLVELLIVVAIMGVLAAMMSLTAGSSTATAKAAAINNNIHNIKMAAMMYMIQQGDSFAETNLNATVIDATNAVSITTLNTNNTRIQYKIVGGTEEDKVITAGAYVICSFANDTDKTAIATALGGFRDLRVDSTNATVGSLLYHPTASSQGSDAWDAAMAFPSN